MCAEGRNATVESLRPDRQHRRTHVDIGDHRMVRHQRHLRLARRAGGQVQNRGIGRRAAVRMRSRSPASRAMASRPRARSASRLTAPSASPVSRNPMLHRSVAQHGQGLRIFDEQGARAGRCNRPHQVRRRIARIHRRGDRPVGHDPQVGQVELQTRLGIEGHHVAFADAERPANRRRSRRRRPGTGSRNRSGSRRRARAGARAGASP